MNGINIFQDEFGSPIPGAREKIRNDIGPWAKEFIRKSPFLVFASSDDSGRCDASPRGGKPGFVKIADDKHLILPDIEGNKLFQTYKNVCSNNHVGLIFFIPGIEITARVNGTAERLTREQIEEKGIKLDIFDPDDEAKVIQGLYITVNESYVHCPRALLFSRIWNTDQINKNRDTPPIGKWKPGT